MNQQIVDYLQQNKINYSKEALTQQLRNSSYAENDIQEALRTVYGEEISPMSAPMPTPILNNVSASTQNSGQLEYASLGKRIVGGIVDAIAVIIISVIFGNFFGTTAGNSVSIEGWPVLVLIALTYMYFMVMEVLTGKTIGKYVVKTKVVNEVGGNITWRQAMGRNLMRIVDAFCVYLVGIIAISSSSKKQRLGDMVAKTYVIKD